MGMRVEMETHPNGSTIYISVNIESINIWEAQGEKGPLGVFVPSKD